MEILITYPDGIDLHCFAIEARNNFNDVKYMETADTLEEALDIIKEKELTPEPEEKDGKYLVIECFGTPFISVDEDGNPKYFTWKNAVKDCCELQDGHVLDFDEGAIYKVSNGMPEPKKREWRVYHLFADYPETKGEPSNIRTKKWFDWVISQIENDSSFGEVFTLEEFQASFNSEEISDQSYIVIREVEID